LPGVALGVVAAKLLAPLHRELAERLAPVAFRVSAAHQAGLGVEQVPVVLGALEEEGVYKNGKVEGTVKKYYINGSLLEEDKVKEDKTASSVKYPKKKTNGGVKFNYESGKILTEMNFKDGELDGMLKQYYENGNLCVETAYAAGVMNGINKTYYRNGKVKTESGMVNGIADGISRTFRDDGSVISELAYFNGNLNGLCRTYYANGQLQEETVYEDGEAAHIAHSYKPDGAKNYDDNIAEPKNANEYAKRGDFNYLRSSDYEDAVKDYSAAIQILMDHMKPFEESSQLMKEYVDATAKDEAACSALLVKRGNAYMKLGQKSKAVADYKMACKPVANELALKKLKQLGINP